MGQELKRTRDDWQDKIKEALDYGVIKFNIDTDIQVTVELLCVPSQLLCACGACDAPARQRAPVTRRHAACVSRG